MAEGKGFFKALSSFMKLRLLDIDRKLLERFFVDAVAENGLILACLPKELRTAKVCEAAVGRSAMALEYVPEELKTPDMCMDAIEVYGDMLAWVPDRLKTEDMCRDAVRHDPEAIAFVPEELRGKCLHSEEDREDGTSPKPRYEKAETMTMQRS